MHEHVVVYYYFHAMLAPFAFQRRLYLTRMRNYQRMSPE